MARNSQSAAKKAPPRAAAPQAAEAERDNAPPRRALGRGLAALMPAPQAMASTPAAVRTTGYRVLPIERIHPCPTQPRKVFEASALAELGRSIATHGVLQPLVVRRAGDGFELVAGERRWRAAQAAGLTEVPAIVKELTDAVALQLALVENVQRQDLDALEEASAFSRLIQEHGLTHDAVAEAVSKSRSAVSNSLRLLKLPDEIQAMLADGRLTAGHARALMGLTEGRDMLRLAHDFVGRHTSVRDAEAQVRALAAARGRGGAAGGGGGGGGGAAAPSPAHVDLQERLQQALGTRVRLHEQEGSGRIEVFFHSLDALDGLLDRLCRP